MPSSSHPWRIRARIPNAWNASRPLWGAAQHASRWIIELARKLIWVREHSPKAKPVADWARAGIARYSLAPVIGRKAGKRGSAVERLTRLIDWMKSTGEFKQEALRLDN